MAQLTFKCKSEMLLNSLYAVGFLCITTLIYEVSCLTYNDVGKCKNVAPNPNYVLTPSKKIWNHLYVLDTPMHRTIACSKSSITQNPNNGIIYVNSTTTGIDGRQVETLSRRFDLRQGKIKEFVTGEDGTQLEFNLYFLKHTGCNTLVYYRCSDRGTLIYDSRYIISTEQNISSECLRKSLAVANGQDFKGNKFIKLPNPSDKCKVL